MRFQRRLGSILALTFALLAVPTPAAAKAAKTRGAKAAQSIGAPNAGKLAGAALLKGSRTLHQRKDTHSWGLPALVHLIQYTAARVAKKHKNATLLVGDLSGKTGGPLPGHNSHQTGRDADIGFFVMNSKGKPISVQRFVPFDNSGKGRDLAWAIFDEARNWATVEALLSYDKAEVRYIFVTTGLRAKLLAYAARKHVAKELIDRAAAVMMSPRDADLHDDHFHVRIACPDSTRPECVEEAVAHEKVADKEAATAAAAP